MSRKADKQRLSGMDRKLKVNINQTIVIIKLGLSVHVSRSPNESVSLIVGWSVAQKRPIRERIWDPYD